uniref:Uncharacterized protein n=1 Tax=Trypanosoma congolense (strain IL3000) TaxID=1068625 RepID=G0UJ56_TRYCI|nr:conserved hypothetical protein [Trypanosoma congolense IL3000]
MERTSLFGFNRTLPFGFGTKAGHHGGDVVSMSVHKAAGSDAFDSVGSGQCTNGEKSPGVCVHPLSLEESQAFLLSGVVSLSCGHKEEYNVQQTSRYILRQRRTPPTALASDDVASLVLPSMRGEANGYRSVVGGAFSEKHISLSKECLTSPEEHVPVCVVDDTVMCNIVPLIPRKHSEYGLVSQIVPLITWPSHTEGTPCARSSGCGWGDLHQCVALASRAHHNHLQFSNGEDPPPGPEVTEGCIVEWVSGCIGYTTDTSRLWAEQRILDERYYSIPPLEPPASSGGGDCDDDVSNMTGLKGMGMGHVTSGGPHSDGSSPKELDGLTKKDNSDEGLWEVRYTKPHHPPSTLRGSVLEQLRRFRVTPRYAPTCFTKATGNKDWMLLFARVVEVGQDCAAQLEELLKRWSTDPAMTSRMLCDDLLDEVLLVGVAPRQEPHRMALVCPSIAYRMLTAQYIRNHRGGDHGILRVSCAKRAATELFDAVLQTLREALRRRIGVQYELLRLLRTKALIFAYQDLIAQYSRWYSVFPSPRVILHVLAGCTIFSDLVALWLSKTGNMPRISTENVAAMAGVKRTRQDSGGSRAAPVVDSGSQGGDTGNRGNALCNPLSKGDIPVEQDGKDARDSAQSNTQKRGRGRPCKNNGVTRVDTSTEECNRTHDGSVSDTVQNIRSHNNCDGSTSCDGNSNGAVEPPISQLVSVPHEMELLEDDYLNRFTALLRGHSLADSGGGSGDASRDASNDGSSNVSSAAGPGGGANGSGNGHSGCDEVALSTLVSWLRRQQCTMTVADFDAFLRKQHY